MTPPPPEVSRVLTLDLGTYLGWCLRRADGTISSGQEHLERLKSQPEGFQFLRFRQFLVQADQHVGGLDHIVYEQKTFNSPGRRGGKVVQGGFKAAQLYGAWWGILLGWCAYKRIPCYPVHVSTLKKSVAGHGHAKKWQIAEACQAYWPGWNPKSEDESDARGLMLHFIRELDPAISQSAPLQPQPQPQLPLRRAGS